MSVELATAYVQLVPSARGMEAAITSQLGGPSAAAGAASGSAFGGGFNSSLAKVAGVGIAVGIATKIGSDFEQAFDTIRVGTGATGEALQSLEDDFNAVATSVPTSFGNASTAIADLNTRLGLTGEPLQGISEQMLELSRITGTDLGTNIESVTRALGDAGIPAENMAGAIDELFRASQATGPSVSRLADLAVQFGAPMRQFGFSFSQSAALLGKFEKEGVNTELVMGSLRIALGKMAKAGEDPVQGLTDTVDQIKNAGSAAEANALAIETFGARAGPDMAAAIREGRFELGDLLDTVANGSETVLGAAADTEDLGEKWTLLKNKILIGLQPAFLSLFDSLGEGVESLIPVVDALVPVISGAVKVFSEIPGPVLAGAVGVLTFAKVGGKLVSFGKTAVTAVSSVSKAFSLLAANPWVLVIIAAVALAFLIVKYWDEIKAALIETWDAIKDAATATWDAISSATTTAWDAIKQFFIDWWPELLGIFTLGIGTVVGEIYRHWDEISATTRAVWGGIKAFMSSTLSAISGFFTTYLINPVKTIIDFFAGLPAAATTAWDGVKNAISNAAAQIKTKLGEIAAAADKALGPLDEIIGGAASFASKAASAIGLHLATGGFVPGPLGAPQPAIVHGGELVLNPGQQDAYARALLNASTIGAGSGGARTFHQTIDLRGATVRNDDDIKTIVRAIDRLKAGQGLATGQGLNW